MNSEELNFKTDLIIPDSFYKECSCIEYNVNDLDKIIKLLDGLDPLNILKGLIGLKKIYTIESEKEEPNILYNDINKLFNLLEKYPVDYKYECLICLTAIENINFKNDKQIKNEPTDKIIKIILYILEFPNQFEIDLLIKNLEYIKILVNNKDIIGKLGCQNLYKKLMNLIENEYSDDKIIIELCLDIIHKLLENDDEEEELKNFIIDLITFLNDLMNKFESSKEILEASLRVIFSITNVNVNVQTATMPKVMNKIIELNLLKKIIDKIDKLNPEEDRIEILLSIRIIGNFAAMENSYYTDKVIELNILDKLKILIQDKYVFNIRKECAWIISNIAAGTANQINLLYENNFPDILFDIILNGNDDSVKDNCLWALYNFSNINNMEKLNNLIERGFIDIIINRLKLDQGDVLCCSLEALNNILIRGKNNDPANYNMIESKVHELDILKELKNFALDYQLSDTAKNKLRDILINYFGIADVNQFLNSNNAVD